MNRLRQLDTDDPELSSVVEQIRSALKQSPEPSVEARHIAAIVKQARRSPRAPIAGPLSARRSGSRPVRLAVKLGAVAAGLGLVTGGLALAGVDIPMLPDRASGDASEATEDSVGAEVASENGDDGSETAERVQATIETNLPLLHAGNISGCEFGALVSAAARDVAPDSSHCTASESESDKGSETAERVQGAITANLPLLHAGDISGCEFGALVSAAARDVVPDSSHCSASEGETDDAIEGSAGTKETGQGKDDKTPVDKDEFDDTKSTGQDKADDTKSTGQDKADDTKSTGQDKAEEASGGKAGGNGAGQSAEGKAKGEDAKAAGRAKAEEASGGKSNPGGKSNKD